MSLRKVGMFDFCSSKPKGIQVSLSENVEGSIEVNQYTLYVYE